EVLNVPVMLKGKKIGTLSDLIVVETSRIPEVKSLYVTRSFGYPGLIIPWENVVELAGHRIDIDIPALEPYEGKPAEDAILLKDYVMDKKVLDLEESEVEVVYDIRL